MVSLLISQQLSQQLGCLASSGMRGASAGGEPGSPRHRLPSLHGDMLFLTPRFAGDLPAPARFLTLPGESFGAFDDEQLATDPFHHAQPRTSQIQSSGPRREYRPLHPPQREFHLVHGLRALEERLGTDASFYSTACISCTTSTPKASVSIRSRRSSTARLPSLPTRPASRPTTSTLASASRSRSVSAFSPPSSRVSAPPEKNQPRVSRAIVGARI